MAMGTSFSTRGLIYTNVNCSRFQLQALKEDIRSVEGYEEVDNEDLNDEQEQDSLFFLSF
jgi:hypothetical protein